MRPSDFGSGSLFDYDLAYQDLEEERRDSEGNGGGVSVAGPYGVAGPGGVARLKELDLEQRQVDAAQTYADLVLGKQPTTAKEHSQVPGFPGQRDREDIGHHQPGGPAVGGQFWHVRTHHGHGRHRRAVHRQPRTNWL